MKGRCTRKTHNNYHSYGGRGISVCERWLYSFENFFADMGSKPTPQHSIDRIDNDKGYSKHNCRWATSSEQTRNTRRNVIVEYNGKNMTAVEASEKSGINQILICSRVRKGIKNVFNENKLNSCFVLNIDTGIYYNNLKEASVAQNIGYSCLRSMKRRAIKSGKNVFNNFMCV